MVLRKKSMRVMHFLKRNTRKSNLFKNLNILNLLDKVTLENCILNCKCFNQSLTKTFKNLFTLAVASYNTRWLYSCCLSPVFPGIILFDHASYPPSPLHAQIMIGKCFWRVIWLSHTLYCYKEENVLQNCSCSDDDATNYVNFL